MRRACGLQPESGNRHERGRSERGGRRSRRECRGSGGVHARGNDLGTQDGKPHTTSIDAAGNYDTNSGAEHVDHGKYAMVDGKACFTSAMNQDGPECWTVQQTEVGQSMDSTSDKGNKLTVTRRDYVAFTPKG